MELSVRRLFLPGGTYSGGPQLFSSTRLCESDICAKENRQCISTLAVFSWARVDYASRASKKAPQGPFCRRDVWRRPQLFESTLGYALKSFGQKKNSSIFTTLEFLVGAGGFEQLAFTHTYTGELKNQGKQATFHFTQDSLKQQCAQFCA